MAGRCAGLLAPYLLDYAVGAVHRSDHTCGATGRVRSSQHRTDRNNRTQERPTAHHARDERSRRRRLLDRDRARPPRELVRNILANPRVRVNAGRGPRCGHPPHHAGSHQLCAHRACSYRPVAHRRRLRDRRRRASWSDAYRHQGAGGVAHRRCDSPGFRILLIPPSSAEQMVRAGRGDRLRWVSGVNPALGFPGCRNTRGLAIGSSGLGAQISRRRQRVFPHAHSQGLHG